MSFKLTKSRKLILDLLKKESKPITAETIYQKLNKSIYLSTVYRNLELFSENNLVSRFILNNVSYYYINKTDHKHFMICLECHDMFEIPCTVVKNNNLVGKHTNFKVTSHELTVYGYCEKCQKSNLVS